MGSSVHFLPFQWSATVTGIAVTTDHPAASHEVAVGQDTPSRRPSVEPWGSGAGCVLHFLPFHCIASTASWKLRVGRVPTAVQSEDAGHDTPNRTPAPGVTCLCHRPAVHRSASVKAAVLVWDEPTAVHCLADEHETESKVAVALGRNSPDSVQRDPFQRSAKPEITPWALNSPPTAMHSREVGHDTPSSELETAFGGCGVFAIDHRDPFQRSTTGTVIFPATTLPTAVHARRDEHVTAFRKLVGEPAGLGVRTIRQRVPSHRSASMLIDAGFAASRWAFRADSPLVCLASSA